MKYDLRTLIEKIEKLEEHILNMDNDNRQTNDNSINVSSADIYLDNELMKLYSNLKIN